MPEREREHLFPSRARKAKDLPLGRQTSGAGAKPPRLDDDIESPDKDRAVALALARVEDSAELSLVQRRWLSARLRYGSDQACCDALGIGRSIAAHWKKQPAYAAAYRDVMESSVAAQVDRTKEELQRLVGLVPETIAEMLVAEETLPLGNTGGTFSRPAWQARGKAVELLLRPLGLWQPQPTTAAETPVSEALAALREVIALRRAEVETREQLPAARVIDVTPSQDDAGAPPAGAR